MKLEDFVSETLKEVMQGVKKSQATSNEHGGCIAPHYLKLSENMYKIEFDIAVTTTEGTSTQSGVGVFVGPVALGSKGHSDASSQSLSRIKFSVPVTYPRQTQTAVT